MSDQPEITKETLPVETQAEGSVQAEEPSQSEAEQPGNAEAVDTASLGNDSNTDESVQNGESDGDDGEGRAATQGEVTDETGAGDDGGDDAKDAEDGDDGEDGQADDESSEEDKDDYLDQLPNDDEDYEAPVETKKLELDSYWTVWFDYPEHDVKNKAEWQQTLETVYTFNCVETYWQIYNHLKPVHDLVNRSNYHIFKLNIEPSWEDPQNASGGKWVFELPKRTDRKILSEQWTKLSLGMIGGIIPHEKYLNGIVVSLRKRTDKLSLWINITEEDESNKQVILDIGHAFKNLVVHDQKLQITFQRIGDSTKHKSSYNNTRRLRI